VAVENLHLAGMQVAMDQGQPHLLVHVPILAHVIQGEPPADECAVSSVSLFHLNVQECYFSEYSVCRDS
jgi:hypothetical protein